LLWRRYVGGVRVLVSILGFFFYIVTAFSVIVAVMIGASSRVTLPALSRYPRPVVESTVAAANTELRRPSIASKINGERSTDYANAARIVSNPNAVPDNLARERDALQKFPGLHDSYEARDRIADGGNAGDAGYSAGLEAQR
jgi:hypothetical protein